jgi:hypothetical protein
MNVDVTGMKHSLFGCDNKHVDYALPNAVNLISLGGRVTATRIDGGYIVAGLTSSAVPHGTNSDVAIELVFYNPIRIVGIAFPHTSNVRSHQFVFRYIIHILTLYVLLYRFKRFVHIVITSFYFMKSCKLCKSSRIVTLL